MSSSSGSRRRLALGLLLFALGAAPLDAQQAAEQPASGGQTTPTNQTTEPRPVPPAEIATRATEVVNRLREIRRVATPVAQIQKIAEDLPAEVADIGEFRRAEVNQNFAETAPRLLDEAQQQWEHHESTLKRWNDELDRRARDVQAARDEITGVDELWRLTAEARTTADLPAAVRQQIQAVLAEIDLTANELRAREEVLLTLQNQISEQRIAIAATLEEIGAQLAVRQEHFFVATVPPVWQAVSEGPLAAQLGRDLADTKDRALAGLQEFVREFRREMLIHLLVFVALILLIAWLHQRTDVDPDAATEIEAARSLLRRPVAASGLISTLTLSAMYSDAPAVVQSIVPIVALPFAALLTPGLVPPERRRMIYVALILTLLVNLQALIVAQGVLRQLSLIVIAGIGLVRLGAFRRRIRAESPVVWPGITRAMFILGWPTLGATLVAAVLGYLAFAEMLAAAIIESAYLGYLLLAAMRVVDALVFLTLRTSLARRVNGIRLNAAGIRLRIASFVRLAAFVLWALVVLRRLYLRDQVIAALGTWLTRTLSIGSLHISLGSLLLFVFVLWLSLFLSRIVRSLLQDDLLPRANMGRGSSHTISMLVNYSIIGLGFLFALAAAGFHVEQFAIIGGALGVGIGFGLQNVVNNFVSGLILVFERPVQVGDAVEVGSLVGTVRRIGIRSSTIRTFEEAEVIVPNSDLISSHVVNWTLSDQLRRVEVKVGVAYGTDPVRVQEILVAVAKKHEKVLDYPTPYALFKGFGDSSLDFVVRFWTSDFGNWIFIASEVTVGIEAALKEAGITIPFPQRDLHIYAVDPPAPLPDGGRPAVPPIPDGADQSRLRRKDGDA